MDAKKKRPWTRRTRGPGKHGYLRGGACPPEYDVWVAMVQRTTNPSCKEYPLYGGRGIKVCPRWLAADGFANFMADVGPRPPSPRPRGVSLHRIDNDGDYEPGNVVWADRTTQARNTRRNRVLTYNGRAQLLVEWAGELDMLPGTLSQRLRKGMSVEEALTTPVEPRKPSSQWKRAPNAKKRGPKPLPRDAAGNIIRNQPAPRE